MMNSRIGGVAVVAAICMLAFGAPGAEAVRLDDTAIYIEINDTDGDAGIHLFLDGEGWKRMRVFDPDDNKILDFRGSGSVGFQGITELFFESAEPSFDEQPLEELLALFPEGIYKFRGKTTEGAALRGRARLTHALPAGPLQVFPTEDDEVARGEAFTVQWEPVSDPPGSEIENYQVIVVCEEPGVELQADVGPDVDSLRVPAQFLSEDVDECKWEILAREASGNQTISETEFGLE